MRKNILNLSAAALMSALAITPVAAENAYAPVTGTQTTFTSTITLDAEANVPNVTFKYAVSAGTAKAAADGTLAVYAGNDAARTNGVLPTIEDVTFAVGDQKETGDTAVKHTATVDFSGTQYKEPGIYRYIVTESGEAQGITDKEKSKEKALDVYVTDNDGTLVVSAYVMHNDVDADAEKLDETKELTDKDTDYDHLLTTSDLTISKTVTGNQGSHDEYFKITVSITGADPGTKFDVAGNYDTTTKVTGANTETHENPTSITAGDDGTVTQEFWIQHNQNIVIQGMGGKTGYTIVEDNRDYVVTTSKTEGEEAAVEGDTATVTDDAITADSTVAYTNNKQGAIPTGVFMTVGGSAAVTLVAASGIVLHMRKKKDEE